MFERSEREMIADQLKLTISGDPASVKSATNVLREAEKLADFGVNLLDLMISHTADHVGLAAAINLKNYIIRNWQILERNDFGSVIPREKKMAIRTGLIMALDKVPPSSKAQIVVCLSSIASYDFVAEWPTLIGELETKIESEPIAVFSVLDSVFKKYRHSEKCQELWSEIRFVIDTFASSFLNLYMKCLSQITAVTDTNNFPPNLLKFASLSMEIIQSLVSQDLVDHFEENLEVYAKGFLVVLNLDPPRNSDMAETYCEAVTSTCNCAGLFIRNYSEFLQFAQLCIEAVWKALSNAMQTLSIANDENPAPNGHDQMICAALKFLTDAATFEAFADAMSDEGALRNLCENVIIPCIVPRDDDLLDENVEDVVRKELESSSADTDSIRGCAARLIDVLCFSMERKVIAVFGQYIEALLGQYNQSTVNWKQKDVATFLVICVAKRGQTAKHGVVRTSSAIDIPRFFNDSLKIHLIADCSVDPNPILKMDAMMYLTEFRYILGKPVLIEAIPYVMNLINPPLPPSSTAYAISASACHTIERLLAMTDSPLETVEKALFKVEDIQPIFEQLVLQLLQACERKPDNEYAVKALLRCCLNCQSQLPTNNIHEIIIAKITALIENSIKQPRKPMFNHYSFEVVALVASAYGQTLTNLTDLVVLLLGVIDNDLVDFVPYALQVMALLAGTVEGVAAELVNRQDRICGDMMDVAANRGGCVAIICAIVQQAVRPGKNIAIPDSEKCILPVFNKMFSSRPTERDAIHFAECVLYHNLDKTFLHGVYGQICRRLTQIAGKNEKRYGKLRAQKYSQDVIHLTSLLLCRYNPDDILTIIDELQNELCLMIIKSLFLNREDGIGSFLVNHQRTLREMRNVGYAVVKLLTESQKLIDPQTSYGVIFCELFTTFWQALTNSIRTTDDIDFSSGGLAFVSAGNNLKFCEGLKAVNPTLQFGAVKTWNECVVQMCKVLGERFESLGQLLLDEPNRRRFSNNLVNEYSRILRNVIKQVEDVRRPKEMGNGSK